MARTEATPAEGFVLAYPTIFFSYIEVCVNITISQRKKCQLVKERSAFNCPMLPHISARL